MTTVHLTGPDTFVTASVDSFLANLPEMLGAMADDSRCIVVIVEFEDRRYVQLWVSSDGVITSEVVSNFYIVNAARLTAKDEDRLRRSGWEEPLGPTKANWRYHAHDVGELVRLVAMIRDVVTCVFRERSDRTISMRTFPMGSPYDRPAREPIVDATLCETEGRRNEV